MRRHAHTQALTHARAYARRRTDRKADAYTYAQTPHWAPKLQKLEGTVTDRDYDFP